MTGKNHSEEDYLAHARAVAERFERRRKQFLKQLKLRSLAAALLLLTFPLWYALLERLDHAQGGALSSAVWFFIHFVAGVVVIAFIVAYAVMPLFRYRHYTVQFGNSLPGMSGMIQQHVSLKGEIFSEMFSYFGTFTLSNARKLALRSIRNAPGLPEFDEYASEDYIRGAMDGMSVEMTEAELSVRQDGVKKILFGGLMIVLDISDPSLILRGKFSGRTVVIAGAAHDGSLAERYGGFRRVEMPDSFAQQFEAYTTDREEAARLVTPGLLRLLLSLSEAVRSARNQVRHVDDRVAYAISGIASGIGDVLAIGVQSLANWFRTGSFRIQSLRHGAPVSAAAGDAGGFNDHVHCAFYDDKVLITIPHSHNLFEPETIFYPPLREEDIKLVYELMTMVDGLTDSIKESLPKEMV